MAASIQLGVMQHRWLWQHRGWAKDQPGLRAQVQCLGIAKLWLQVSKR